MSGDSSTYPWAFVLNSLGFRLGGLASLCDKLLRELKKFYYMWLINIFKFKVPN